MGGPGRDMTYRPLPKNEPAGPLSGLRGRFPLPFCFGKGYAGSQPPKFPALRWLCCGAQGVRLKSQFSGLGLTSGAVCFCSR